jgi:hypothetical protein
MSSAMEPSPSGGAGARTPIGSATAATMGGGAVSNLADVLERVLDKGIVVVGDIRVNLLDIELLTIKLRLIVAGVDTARRIGINWWETDPWVTGRDAQDDHRSLRDRVGRLERELESEPRSARALERENKALQDKVARLERQAEQKSSSRSR